MNEVKIPRESKLIKVMFEYYNDYVKEISSRETKPNYIPICFTVVMYLTFNYYFGCFE